MRMQLRAAKRATDGIRVARLMARLHYNGCMLGPLQMLRCHVRCPLNLFLYDVRSIYEPSLE
jgi:hypothetical protein